MLLQKLDILFTILAALTVAAAGILGGNGLNELVFSLIITITVFYTIGFFMKRYLEKTIRKSAAENDDKTKKTNQRADRLNEK